MEKIPDKQKAPSNLEHSYPITQFSESLIEFFLLVLTVTLIQLVVNILDTLVNPTPVPCVVGYNSQ